MMRRDDDEVLCSVLADHSHTKSSCGKLLPNAPAAVKLDQSLPGRVLMSASVHYWFFSRLCLPDTSSQIGIKLSESVFCFFLSHYKRECCHNWLLITTLRTVESERFLSKAVRESCQCGDKHPLIITSSYNTVRARRVLSLSSKATFSASNAKKKELGESFVFIGIIPEWWKRLNITQHRHVTVEIVFSFSGLETLPMLSADTARQPVFKKCEGISSSASHSLPPSLFVSLSVYFLAIITELVKAFRVSWIFRSWRGSVEGDPCVAGLP